MGEKVTRRVFEPVTFLHLIELEEPLCGLCHELVGCCPIIQLNLFLALRRHRVPHRRALRGRRRSALSLAISSGDIRGGCGAALRHRRAQRRATLLRAR